MSNTWIELDLETLRSNIRNLQAALKAGTEIIFVVKSNAYGHGIIPVVRCAALCGVKWFAVANINEALTVRELLPDAGIIVVGVMDQAAVPQAIDNRIIPLVVSEKHATALAATAASLKAIIRCHAKIDTGMGRLGFIWNEAPEVLTRLAGVRGLEICGFCTHFASAGAEDRKFAEIQARHFQDVVRLCEEKGLYVSFKHVSNSHAVICNRAWNMEGVRPGILLYGYGDRTETGRQLPAAARPDTCVEVQTRPFLQWKTRIVQIRKVPAGFPVSYDSTYTTPYETNIAVIDAGYADGYARKISNEGAVLAGGKRCPVVGRVTMNLTMIDVGLHSSVQEGDEAVLIGSQGSESIWADEIAQWCETIPYEILTGIRTSTAARIVS